MDEPPSGAASTITAGDRLYVSRLVGAALKTPSGKTLGKVKDVVARVAGDAPAPVIHGLVARLNGSELHFVPWDCIARMDPGGVSLNCEDLDRTPFERRPGEILLVKDLRDKEVVHVEGKRVARANDIAMEPLNDRWIIAGIDVSTAALLEHFGLSGLVKKRKRDLLPWDEVEIFKGTVPVPLHLTHDKIARLHPADIAKLFHNLGYQQSSELLEDLSDELAADVVEDLAPEYQATLLASLDRERAADILEEMPPDAAADVLNDIVEEDPEAAEELVQSMEDEEAAAVEQLRGYPDNTAGGLMTTEYVSMPATFTVDQAMALLRAEKQSLPPLLDPILVVRELGGRQLVGLVSLKNLVLADPKELLESIMQKDVVVRHVDDSAREVARTVAHYNLVALPILDEQEQIAGVVPINAAMDVILPREWVHRMPRPFIGGHSLI